MFSPYTICAKGNQVELMKDLQGIEGEVPGHLLVYR